MARPLQFGSCCCAFAAHRAHLCCLSTWTHCHQVRHSAQIHDGGAEREHQIDFVEPAQLHLHEDGVLLGVAEDRFDERARKLTQPVSACLRSGNALIQSVTG